MKRDAPADGITLRISVTPRCDLRCAYCSPARGPARALPVAAVVRFVRAAARARSVRTVRLTGGEPLLRRDLPRLVAAIAAEGVPDLALTTNGQRLAKLAAPLRASGLRRVNVSLDSLDPGRFAGITGGGDLGATLTGIEAARAAGLAPVKINVVVQRGANDVEIVRMARWAIERGLDLRFLEVMPIAGPGPDPVSAFSIVGALAVAFRVEALPRRPGRTSRDLRLVERGANGRGLRGTVGLIASVTHPFCEGCRRLRLTSDGRLVTCLARGDGPDLRDLLLDGSPEAAETLARVLREAVRHKRPRRGFRTALPMAAVGG